MAIRLPVLSLTLSPLLLAACGSQSEHSDESLAAEQADAQATSAVTADMLDDGADSAESKDANGFSSRYTSVVPDDCKTLERETEEGSYIRQSCPGIGDIALIVEEGDGRMFVHAGNDPSDGETMSPFNTLSPKVEWRMKDGKPVAIIYRLKVATPDVPQDGNTQLFVSKIGTGSSPSCVMAEIAGSYPDANAKARKIADGAADYRCGRDEKQMLGDAIE